MAASSFQPASPSRGWATTREPQCQYARRSALPGPLGFARTVELPGLGVVTYGQLVIRSMQQQVKELREDWASEALFVAQSLGVEMLRRGTPLSAAEMQKASSLARNKFRARSGKGCNSPPSSRGGPPMYEN
ncbi:KRUF family protein [Besnoitia besnoiti]|uniref:KRUF family protein n=1 Tax=Besnoitia besnoiti TaxID=94643 RepID=A0A2A9LZ10_BESBE|nr:KRUF family protein [Besnoitia besnoiti]PFH31678.1 KRUF family protein [Besnoitia besnoiti]